ncbi:MAG: hypothetical protein ACE5HD_06410 [Acidobacteriota bacterium]
MFTSWRPDRFRARGRLIQAARHPVLQAGDQAVVQVCDGRSQPGRAIAGDESGHT